MKRVIASVEVIENRILLIRGHKVMIDADLWSRRLRRPRSPIGFVRDKE
jgi:hypothetical protein